MKLNIFIPELGFEVIEVTLNFRDDFIDEPTEAEQGNGRAWKNQKGQIARVIFDDVRLEQDAKILKVFGKSVNLKILKGIVDAELIE